MNFKMTSSADADHRDWGQLNAHVLECVMAKLAGSSDRSNSAFKVGFLLREL